MKCRCKSALRALVLLLTGWLALIATAGIGCAADYRPLIGRWQRIDGGYVIDVRQVEPDGSIDARYLNPRTINVSQANASTLKGYLKIFLELSDVGYPGSTYTLIYDPEKDILLGTYYQAVQRQNYDVIFVRMTRQ
ncbi:hypothetical protein DSCW_59700 [Desulfosarcina widdelii]|uniref:Uncharacterized protein n=1 Tax=Desulfosarcina widdelii TaxID=947919 RepID=A0A5K7ZFR1_9BACT|nr:hypothetical protein [Desulfosarcina widdelii]BBO78553.1 hypothetical protein DSCW_59700 [Desulfosarcina widdelii]